MADRLEMLLEAERRGILPSDKLEMLTEARNRGLIPGTGPPIPEPVIPDLVEPRSLGTQIGRSVAEGATLGFFPEIVGAGQTALGSVGLGPERPLSENIEAQEAVQEAIPPEVRIPGNIAGGLGTGLGVAGAIPRAAISTLPRAAATGAGLGAVEGAIGGAGFAPQGERTKGAVQGAALGGAIGGTLPGVQTGTRNIFNATFGTGRAARQAGVPRKAFEFLEEAIEPDSVGAQRRLADIGPEAMLADVGRGATSAVDFLGQRPGPSQRVINEALGKRVTSASKNVTQAMDTAFGKPAGIRTVETGLRRGTAKARRDAYDIAYDQVIDYSDELGGEIENIIRTRVPRAAVSKANALMRAEGASNRQILVRTAEDGSLIYENLPNVQQIDYITRALNDVADAASGQGKIGGTTNLGRVFGNLSSELRSLTKEAVPEYATALRTAAQPIAARNALQLGRQSLSPRIARDELTDALKGLSEAERSYVAQGVRSQIDETLANVKTAFTDPNMNAREAAKALKDLSSRAVREKIETVIGPENASGLFTELDRASAAFQLRASAAENSKTAVRQMFEERFGKTGEGIVERLRSGRPVEATRELSAALLGRSEANIRKMSDQSAQDLAEALVGRQGPDAQKLLSGLEGARSTVGPRADRAQRIAEQLLLTNPAIAGQARER